MTDRIETKDAKKLLDELRWTADRIITNYAGERVWLKSIDIPGGRTGVTDCCLVEWPCEYHKKLTHEAKND
jgi:hypothetical protein